MSGNTHKRYPAELKQRAVRMYAEMRPDQATDWAAMARVAELLGRESWRSGSAGWDRSRTSCCRCLPVE